MARSMRVFVDTDVLIDVLARREQWYREAARIWTMAELGKITGVISALSVSNIYYIVRKLEGLRAANKALIILRDTFELAPTTGQIVNQAVDAKLKDYEDAVQYFTALQANADFLVTRNLGDFPKDGILVLDPLSYLIRNNTQPV
jgi:predicted nucleic acid-binding protein